MFQIPQWLFPLQWVFFNCTRPDVCWKVDSCLCRYNYSKYDWFLTRFPCYRAFTRPLTKWPPVRTESKYCHSTLFVINYVSHFTTMHKVDKSVFHYILVGNIKDPQMQNGLNELQCINVKENWLGGYWSCSGWCQADWLCGRQLARWRRDF